MYSKGTWCPSKHTQSKKIKQIKKSFKRDEKKKMHITHVMKKRERNNNEISKNGRKKCIFCKIIWVGEHVIENVLLSVCGMTKNIDTSTLQRMAKVKGFI